MSTISSFRSIENKHDVGKNCMKKFCELLREHKLKIISKKEQNEVINKRATEII